jgi:hypothetical protein
MTSEANMPTDPQRKSLDDIRRELELEFGRVAGEDTAPEAAAGRDRVDRSGDRLVDRPSGHLVDRMIPRDCLDDEHAELEPDDDVPAEPKRFVEKHWPKWRGDVLAALVGCIVGQLLLLGFLIVSRYSVVSRLADVTVSSKRVTSATVTPPVATPQRAPAPSSTAEDAAAAPTLADAETPPPSGTVVVSESSRSVAQSESAPASATPPAATADLPDRVSAPLPGSSDVPRRMTSATTPGTPADVPKNAPPQAHQSAPSPARPRATRFTDWAESQAQVRAALREWLASSGLVSDSLASDAVVILDADGRTARTHVPVRWGGVVVVREQRWERRSGGWTLIAERNISDQR